MENQPSLKDIISKAKEEINLVALATEKYGFTLREDKGKETGRWVVLERADEHLLVQRNDKAYSYSSQNDETNKGTVIDFLSREHQLNLTDRNSDWGKLANMLKEYLNMPLTVQHTMSRNTNVSNGVTPMLENLDLRPYTHRSYLQGRGLGNVIGHPEFENKIFNRPFKNFNNTAFPIENERGEIIGVNVHGGYDQKTGKNFKQTYGMKQEGLWVSNAIPGQRVKELVIAESPIDAMSYHALKPTQAPGERLYAVTIGNITHRQPISLQRLISHFKPERIVFANDNESSGIRFNLKLLGLLNPNPNFNPVRIDVSWGEKTPVTLLVESNGQSKEKVKELIDKVDKIINAGVPTDLQRAEVLPYFSGENQDKIKITVPNSKPFLERTEIYIADVRGITQQMKIDRSQAKDWNDELKASLVSLKAENKADIKPTIHHKI